MNRWDLLHDQEKYKEPNKSKRWRTRLDTQRTNVDELVEVLKKNKGWQGRRTHGAMNIKDKWAWSRSQDLHKTYEYFYWFSWGFAWRISGWIVWDEIRSQAAANLKKIPQTCCREFKSFRSIVVDIVRETVRRLIWTKIRVGTLWSI